MNWLLDLFMGHSVAHTVLILSLVISLGVGIGHIRMFGISLGIAGVLFSGLAFGHFQFTVNDEILEFCREFGLILFVYTIGMQVGPSFFASFRKQGLKLNLLAASVVLLGVGVAVGLYFIAGLPIEVVVGLLSGAVTNTPGLGAAQQALREVTDRTLDMALPGMGYAVAYPFGIIGIILTMLLIRFLFRINPQAEAEAYAHQQKEGVSAPHGHNFTVTNPRLAGQTLAILSGMMKTDFVISRLMRLNDVMVPTSDTRLELGDVLHVVCSKESSEKIAMVLGDVSEVDVVKVPSCLSSKPILVTNNEVVGQSLRELDLMKRYGVAITRVHRAGLELVANESMELQFGDRVTAVGDESSLRKVVAELGNSIKKLDHPNLLPIFIGIIAGVILGSLPISLPGLPAPVKLGLAGGPLMMAIILSRLGKVGPVIWYLPPSSNLVLREMGITLFLACVGMKSGGRFLDTLLHGDGLYWMTLAAMITLIPILLVGIVSRLVYKLNYMSLCGLLAGSMTDPPALSFANQIAASDAPAVTYASVYALVMFLRILTAQALVIFLT